MRSIKILALAAVAALAMTAFVGISSASAAQFQAEEYPATVTGATLESHHLTVNEASFNCEKAAFEGELPEASETLTVTPELEGCTFLNVTGVPWQMNGCKYRFHAGGTMDITGCSNGLHLAAFGCDITIPPQNGLGSIKYENVGEEESAQEIVVVANISGLKYTQQGGWCVGGEGTFSNGSYWGTWKVSAMDEIGEPVSLSVE